MTVWRSVVVDAGWRRYTVRAALQPDGSYPPIIGPPDEVVGGEDAVLARLPKTLSWWDSLVILLNKRRWRRETPALYHEITMGCDAACLTCEVRVHFEDWREADQVLKPCRDRGHSNLLVFCHIADEAPWHEPGFPDIHTVGDVRDRAPLLIDPWSELDV